MLNIRGCPKDPISLFFSFIFSPIHQKKKKKKKKEKEKEKRVSMLP